MPIPLVTAAALLSAGSSLAQPAPAPSEPLVFGASEPQRECRSDQVHRAKRGDAPAARRLGELPPGNLELAVLREVDGCREPVIVRYGIGAAAGQPARR